MKPINDPTPSELHDECLKAIREGLMEMRAGLSRPMREVLAELARKHNLPSARDDKAARVEE